MRTSLLARIANQALKPSCESDVVDNSDLEIEVAQDDITEDEEFRNVEQQREQLEEGVSALESMQALVERIGPAASRNDYVTLAITAGPALEMFGVDPNVILPALESEEGESLKVMIQKNLKRFQEFLAKLWDMLLKLVSRLWDFLSEVGAHIDGKKLAERQRLDQMRRQLRNKGKFIPKDDELEYSASTKYLQSSFGIPTNHTELQGQLRQVHRAVKATVEEIQSQVKRYSEDVDVVINKLGNEQDVETVDQALDRLIRTEGPSIEFPAFRGDVLIDRDEEGAVETNALLKAKTRFTPTALDKYPKFTAMDARSVEECIKNYLTLTESSANGYAALSLQKRMTETFKKSFEMQKKYLEDKAEKVMKSIVEQGGKVDSEAYQKIKTLSEKIMKKNTDVTKLATRSIQSVIVSLQRYDAAYVNMLILNGRNLTDSAIK